MIIEEGEEIYSKVAFLEEQCSEGDNLWPRINRKKNKSQERKNANV